MSGHLAQLTIFDLLDEPPAVVPPTAVPGEVGECPGEPAAPAPDAERQLTIFDLLEGSPARDGSQPSAGIHVSPQTVAAPGEVIQVHEAVHAASFAEMQRLTLEVAREKVEFTADDVRAGRGLR